ncbi:hypothetical protein ACF5W4_11230 [Bacillota bacterium Lsc_1132]
MGNINENIFVGTSFERPGLQAEKPPGSWVTFLSEASALFLKKDKDYDSRFMRGMLETDGRAIWAWEVDKKLDRLRTWLSRGELQVKGEGIRNSVDDLFIYTVQYVYFVQTFINDGYRDPVEGLRTWQYLRDHLFYETAARLKPTEWVEFLVQKERIAPNEKALQQFLRLYMGENPSARDWQEAIRAILAKA